MTFPENNNPRKSHVIFAYFLLLCKIFFIKENLFMLKKVCLITCTTLSLLFGVLSSVVYLQQDSDIDSPENATLVEVDTDYDDFII